MLLVLAALALAGCAGSASTGGGSGYGGSTDTGSGGASGVHCLTTMCVPPVSAHLLWAVEIDPSSNQSVAAIEENPSVDLYDVGNPLSLMASQSTIISASFTASTGASVPSTANVVLTVPSLIPGRPALTFQAPTALTSTGMSSASLTVPSDRLGSAATMVLAPLPPADQVSPPHSFSVALMDGLQKNIPTDDFFIGGTLLDAVAKPLGSTFVARAFQGGTQVSSAPQTASPTALMPGSFQLELPSAALAAGTPLTIQLTPQSQTDPWFVSNPISLPSSAPVPSPGTIMLPAYSNLNQFNLTVVSAVAPTFNVSGAVVRAQATVGTDEVGTTEFARSATTDGNGIASLSLLPGTASTPLPYDITVTLPASSPFQSRCVGSIGVKAGGSTVNTASAPALTPTPVALVTRAILTGAVTDSHGYPVTHVSVAATPGPTTPGACTAMATSQSTVTTDANGTFKLLLDPGTYQLDYDPPSGSSAPRFTEPVPFVVNVSDSGQLVHNVALPPGGLVQGMAFIPGGSQPLVSATIRIFEPRCSGTGCTTPPWLRGQTVTDANGQFQVVVPVPQ
jgi:hypothetical protein